MIWVYITVAVILISVISYYVTRMMKGSIKILMTTSSFGSGENVTGGFQLTSKKSLQGDLLKAILIGKETVRYYDGDEEKSRTKECYRDEVVLEEGKKYPAGKSTKYEFEISSPSQGSSGSVDASIDVGDSKVAKVALNAAKMIGQMSQGRHRSRIDWRVEVRLEMKGVDLADSKKVYING